MLDFFFKVNASFADWHEIKKNKVHKFIEKPAGDSGWINGGFFVFEPEIFNYIKNDKTVLENVKYEFAGLRILKKNTFNSGHAHNSYLHILAELGFLGLILIFCILCEVNSMIKKLPNYERLLLTSCLFAMIISSFTEHRLTTPSQALPFYFLLSLFYGKRNIYNKQNMDGLKNSYV